MPSLPRIAINIAPGEGVGIVRYPVSLVAITARRHFLGFGEQGRAGWALGELAVRDVTLPGSQRVLDGGDDATVAGVLGVPEPVPSELRRA